MLERTELVQSIEFALNMPRSLNFSLPYALLHVKEMTSACSQRSMKELYAKNTGDLPLEVIRIRISGRECGLDGFVVHSCGGFTLKPGESAKLQISYQTDFSAATIHRDLELALATGIFLMPMKASFPYDMLSICKKSMLWMRLKKSFYGFLLVASLIFLVFCYIFPQTIAFGSANYSCKSDTIESASKASSLHQEQRGSNLPMSRKTDNLFCSVEDDTASTMKASCGRHSEQGISPHLIPAPENHKQPNHLLDTPTEKDLPSSAIQNSDTFEASQVGHLMIKTGKERGRRRRKRKGLAAKLTAIAEVSSSQSGNSTPSSPASPVTSATSKCNWPLSYDVEKTPETRTSVTSVALKHSDKSQASVCAAKTNKSEPEIPVSTDTQGLHSAPKAVEMPSTCLPRGSSSDTIHHVSFLASTSSVAPHARAPGSQLGNQNTIEAHEATTADEYAYDIWGRHFTGIHLAVVSRNVTCMMSTPAENNFDSFYVGDPLTLVTNSQEANNIINKF
ncbi:hypothetical protein L6164_019929 [Bauhinia variegata]|nr:hypothetical protein L6164_019929 [Bauhinia variegata]